MPRLSRSSKRRAIFHGRALVLVALAGIAVLCSSLLTSAQPVRLDARLAAARATTDDTTCAEPALPPAQYPGDGHGDGYGVPFVAELSDGSIQGGYNAALYYYDKAKGQNYNPWQVQIGGITGWITGLIEIPSYKVIDGSLSICDVPMPTSGTPPVGAISFSLRTYNAQDSAGPRNTVTYSFGKEFQLINNSTLLVAPWPGASLQAIQVAVDPVQGSLNLGIEGVNQDGTLEVGGSVAVTTSIDSPLEGNCIALKPSVVNPSTAEAPPTNPNPDTPPTATDLNPPFPAPATFDHQYVASALSGPIQGATGSVVDNALQVVQFQKGDPAPNSCGLYGVLAPAFAGSQVDGLSNTPAPIGSPSGPVPVLNDPGWAEFGAHIQLKSIGLPALAATAGSPSDCVASPLGPPAAPYEFQFSGQTTGAGGSLVAGAASATGLTATTCGYLKVVPGPGSCPETELVVPADGTRFGSSSATLSIIPKLPTSAPLTLSTGPITATIPCGGSSTDGLSITAAASPVASTGLFGLSCKIQPSMTLTGNATGPFNAIHVTLGSTSFSVPSVIVDPVACPGTLPASINQILGLPLGPGASSVSLPLSASISVP